MCIKLRGRTLLSMTRRITSNRAKSFTGCKTCKIRRIKCDEVQPACRRCTSTGRRCDGYEGVTYRASPYSQLMVYQHRNHEEVRAFQFFVEDIAPGMSRIVDRTWWHKLIPQASQQDTVIWYAVTALSGLVMHVQNTVQCQADLFTISVSGHKAREAAVSWYNRSVAALRAQLQGSPVWTASHSISAILYMCIEAILGNEQAAFGIYMKADAILQQTRYRRHSLEVLYDDSQAHQSAINLLRHAAAGNGVFYPEKRMVDSENTYDFASWDEAIAELHYFIGECHGFIVHVLESKIGKDKFWQPSDQVLQQRQAFMTRLQYIRTAVECLVKGDHGPEARESGAVMILAYGQFFVWLHQCTSQFETVFDEHWDTFEEMVDAAAVVIDGFPQGKRPVYSFEARLGAGLWFVSMRCRNPELRRKALRLLRRSPMIESTRNHAFTIEMSEKAIAIEEAGHGGGIFHEIPKSHNIPPECDRICWQKDRQTLEHGSIVRHFPYGKWQQDINGDWRVHDYCAILGASSIASMK